MFGVFLAAEAVRGQGAAHADTSSEWVHIESVPGGDACAARLVGREVDTMLMLNRDGQLLLVAGRTDWSASGPEEISLRIDSFELDHLQASAFNNLVLLPIVDGAVLKRLRAAKDLYWSLPSGTYHAAVAGLDGALTWVQECEQAKGKGTGGT
jgi:hypothetical protein